MLKDRQKKTLLDFRIAGTLHISLTNGNSPHESSEIRKVFKTNHVLNLNKKSYYREIVS